MPHKRKTRLQYNPKQVSRRVQITSSVPNVCVKSQNESPTDFMSAEDRPVQQLKAPSRNAANKFAVPQYNTMVRSQVELSSLRKMQVEASAELTPRTKAAIAPKVYK